MQNFTMPQPCLEVTARRTLYSQKATQNVFHNGRTLAWRSCTHLGCRLWFYLPFVKCLPLFFELHITLLLVLIRACSVLKGVQSRQASASALPGFTAQRVYALHALWARTARVKDIGTQCLVPPGSSMPWLGKKCALRVRAGIYAQDSGASTPRHAHRVWFAVESSSHHQINAVLLVRVR